MATRQTTNDAATYMRGAEVHKLIVPFDLVVGDLDQDDLLILAELPNEALVTSIKIVNEDLDTGAGLVVDIGLYSTNKALDLTELVAADLITIDADIYVDGYAGLQAAVVVPVELLGTGSGSVDANDIWETVRSHAGDSIGEEPFKYVLAMNNAVAAGTPAAGALTAIIEYIQG